MTGLIAFIDLLEGEGRHHFWTGLLIFVRVGAALSVAPAIAEHFIPVRVRLAAAIGMTLIVAPAIAPSAQISAFSIFAETINGLLLGLGLRLFTLALQTAGAIAAQSMSLSHLFVGAGAEPQSGFAAALGLAALAIASAAGLHIQIAAALITSHELLPQGRFPAASDLTEWGVAQVSQSFTLAFTLATPFVIAGTLYNVALGAINRAMPMLMVVLIGAPALTFGGLLLFAFTAPLMLQAWMAAVEQFLRAPFELRP